MGNKIFPAGRFTLETDVQQLEDGKFRGVVSIREVTDGSVKESMHMCEQVRETREEAQADADRDAAVRQQQQAPNE